MVCEAVQLKYENFINYGVCLNEIKKNPLVDNAEITYWDQLAYIALNKELSSGIMVTHQRDLCVSMMEQHKRTDEILIALEGDSILCVATDAFIFEGDSSCVDSIFLKQGDAICLNKGIWHCAPFPIKTEDSRFLVLFARGTENNDLITKTLCEKVTIGTKGIK